MSNLENKHTGDRYAELDLHNTSFAASDADTHYLATQQVEASMWNFSCNGSLSWYTIFLQE